MFATPSERGGAAGADEVGPRSLAGLRVVVTGGVSTLQTRDAFAAWLRRRGARLQSAVGAAGDAALADVLLVAGGKAAAADGHLYAMKGERKLRDARAARAAGADVEILDEAGFAAAFGFPAGRR